MKLFLVMVMRTENFQIDRIPAHQAFLDALRSRQRIVLAGAFANASGGAYLLRAESMTEAEGIAHSDPLHEDGSSTVTLREWRAS